jgi:hypothetical protein
MLIKSHLKVLTNVIAVICNCLQAVYECKTCDYKLTFNYCWRLVCDGLSVYCDSYVYANLWFVLA